MRRPARRAGVVNTTLLQRQHVATVLLVTTSQLLHRRHALLVRRVNTITTTILFQRLNVKSALPGTTRPTVQIQLQLLPREQRIAFLVQRVNSMTTETLVMYVPTVLVVTTTHFVHRLHASLVRLVNIAVLQRLTAKHVLSVPDSIRMDLEKFLAIVRMRIPQ